MNYELRIPGTTHIFEERDLTPEQARERNRALEAEGCNERWHAAGGEVFPASWQEKLDAVLALGDTGAAYALGFKYTRDKELVSVCNTVEDAAQGDFERAVVAYDAATEELEAGRQQMRMMSFAFRKQMARECREAAEGKLAVGEDGRVRYK